MAAEVQEKFVNLSVPAVIVGLGTTGAACMAKGASKAAAVKRRDFEKCMYEYPCLFRAVFDLCSAAPESSFALKPNCHKD